MLKWSTFSRFQSALAAYSKTISAGFSTTTTTSSRALEFCIVGSGPAGFYTADRLLKRLGENVRVCFVDRLPTPFGLVRSGVAPDHQDTKNVINQFTNIANDRRVNFFGNVRLGQHIHLDKLKSLFDGVVLATGAESDKRLGIPGESGPNVFSAREFVWWYNGHPDARSLPVNLANVKSVAICGVGNVALDCARVLLRSSTNAKVLTSSDIAAHALAALQSAATRDVHLVARRGPAQAAFTPKELKELVTEPGIVSHAPPQQMMLSAADQELLKAVRTRRRVVDIIQQAASPSNTGDDTTISKHVHFQFYRQPKEVVRSSSGDVQGLLVEHTALKTTEDGAQVAVGTGHTEIIPAQLVLVSIGYKSVPIQGAPFDSSKGIIPNTRGKVHACHSSSSATGTVQSDVTKADQQGYEPGLYVCGWLKRGPTGIIGTNAVDAEDTVSSIMQDLRSDQDLKGDAKKEGFEGLRQLLIANGSEFTTFSDWMTIDSVELEEGEKHGKVREKITNVDDMIKVAHG